MINDYKSCKQYFRIVPQVRRFENFSLKFAEITLKSTEAFQRNSALNICVFLRENDKEAELRHD